MLRCRVLALLVVSLSSCDNSMGCSLAYCTDGFFLQLLGEAPAQGAGAEGELRAGDYELELVLDGTPLRCSAVVPQVRPPSCDGDAVSLAIFPSGLDRAPSAFWLRSEQTPRMVAVLVRHQAAVVAEHSVQLTYDDFAPNGRECGPVCQRAESELPLSFSTP